MQDRVICDGRSYRRGPRYVSTAAGTRPRPCRGRNRYHRRVPQGRRLASGGLRSDAWHCLSSVSCVCEPAGTGSADHPTPGWPLVTAVVRQSSKRSIACTRSAPARYAGARDGAATVRWRIGKRCSRGRPRPRVRGMDTPGFSAPIPGWRRHSVRELYEVRSVDGWGRPYQITVRSIARDETASNTTRS